MIPDATGDVAKLLAGAAGCSPYLAGLIAKEADWLPSALAAPETALSEELESLPNVAPDALASALRRAKRRVALLAGLADLAGVWPLEDVTGALTQLADTAVQCALRTAVGAEIKRGKLPGMGDDDLDTAGGMTVLAMGKMGAGELNYSSDIDLICLFDETRFSPDDFHDARASFIRATRKMSAMLNDMTAEGYVFRTDLRLRPDPAVTPVCIAMAAAETYYESLGRTWERAAYIKARACAGDIAAGTRFLDGLRPFVWRKHLDFAAIQDAHNMRLRIREHKGLAGGIKLPGHNMKLGRGGIREIEFFTQTRQLISGGRDPDLRLRGTVESLSALAAKAWVPDAAAQTLSRHYRAHREVEHRVQMIADAQTHLLPTSDENLERLAAFMGLERAQMEAEITDRLTEVHEVTEGFFAPDAAATVAETDTDDFGKEVSARWTSYAALRSERAVEIFHRLRPELMRRLAAMPRPQEALLAFDGFLSGLPAGVQLFSLFEANPQLIDLLLDIVGTAPALARYLSRNAAVFDAVIGGSFFGPWPGSAALAHELAGVLAREGDYERALDAARRWGKEWHFRVGVHFLRGLTDARQTGAQYADIADATLQALFPVVADQFAAKHGAMPGRGAVVLGMGSLGAGRLSASSDLDLIVIYDAEGIDASDGRRPLATRMYYARLTQALVTAMTAPMAEGRLYEIDMRLRPSGNKGPVATSWQSFQAYQTEEAWVWEHLALTRARVVAGPADLAQDVEAFRQGLLGTQNQAAKLLSELGEMRARIAAAKQGDGPWDMKIGPGRMQDIELFSQAGALLAGASGISVTAGLDGCVAVGMISDAESAVLRAAYGMFWPVQVAAKLLSEKPLSDQDIKGAAEDLLLRATSAADQGVSDAAGLKAYLEAAAARAAMVIEKALSGAGQG